MNFIIKNWYKIALIAIAAGLVLFCVSLALGARGGYVSFGAGGLRFAAADEYILIDEKNLPQFDTVDVRTTSVEIELIASDRYGIEMRVPYYSDEPKWEVRDGKLTVDVISSNNILTFMDFGLQRTYVKIYYPAGSDPDGGVLKSVNLTARSGDIRLTQVSADSIELKTTSGSVKAEMSYYKALSAQCNSGDIVVSGKGDNASLKLGTTSGFIRANVSGCVDVSLESRSGNVSMTGDTPQTAELFAKTSSGDVNADVSAWLSLNAESSSGRIRINGKPCGTTTANARSGNVFMTLYGNERDFSYEITTGSGMIRIGSQRYEKHAKNIDSSAENMINAKTSSGNVRVEFR